MENIVVNQIMQEGVSLETTEEIGEELRASYGNEDVNYEVVIHKITDSGPQFMLRISVNPKYDKQDMFTLGTLIMIIITTKLIKNTIDMTTGK